MKSIFKRGWVWGVAMLLAVSAHAQAPEPLGVLVVAPVGSYGETKAINEGPLRHTVTLLHTTQAIFGSFRTQVATISIRPRTPSPGAPLVFRLPAAVVDLVEEMNSNTELKRVSSGPGFVAVEALQLEQQFVLARTRYLMIPLESLFALQQLNSGRVLTLVHSALLQSGNVRLPVGLVAIDQGSASGVRIPQAILSAVVLLNSNIRVVNPRAVENGVPVSIIDVNPVVLPRQ